MEQLDLFSWKGRKSMTRKPKGAQEWKIVSVRETSADQLPLCVQPDDAVNYWRKHIATASTFNPDVECFAALLLNTKLRIRGHHVVSIGTLNETVTHPREVFRAAVIAAAYGVVLMHNHPSGDPAPSDADLRSTKRLLETGTILQIRVLDHIIVGDTRHFSLREAGLL
jgi:DNA repair protein RadC